MLQAILGGHPDIHTCSEPWVALPFIYALRGEGVEYEFNSRWTQDGVQAFFEESNIDQKFYDNTLRAFLSSFYQKALEGSGKKIFLDKTPRYYEIASDIIRVFPEAKFIVLYRDPLAVLNSILNTWIKEDHAKIYNYSRDLLVAPSKMVDFISNHKDAICLVKYEDFVNSPSEELNKICGYLGVEYVEEILNYNSGKEWFYGDKNFKNKTRPETSLVDAWKVDIDKRFNLNLLYYYISEIGQELYERFGYDYDVSLKEIMKHNPNNKDRKLWDSVLNDYKIASIEDTRCAAVKKINYSYWGNVFDILCGKRRKG